MEVAREVIDEERFVDRYEEISKSVTVVFEGGLGGVDCDREPFLLSAGSDWSGALGRRCAAPAVSLWEAFSQDFCLSGANAP